MSAPLQIVISLGGKPCPLPVACTLAELLASLGHEPQAVSTAVNGSFIARDRRPHRLLQQGDEVLLFKPIVGG